MSNRATFWETRRKRALSFGLKPASVRERQEESARTRREAPGQRIRKSKTE